MSSSGHQAAAGPEPSLRLAVAGKGGAGKSVLAGTLARLLARSGRPLLALDSDLLPGLALSLGAEQPPRPPLLDAAEQGEDGRWRLKRGIGPVRAVARFSTAAPDGVRLLQAGKVGAEGLPPIMAAVTAYYQVVNRLERERALREWIVVGDLPAGPRQMAFGWAPYARSFLIVVEPEWKSILTARRVARIASMRDGITVSAVANKVRGKRDVKLIASRLDLPVVAAVPADAAVRDAERAGEALIDTAPSSPAAEAIRELAEGLLAGGTLDRDG